MLRRMSITLISFLSIGFSVPGSATALWSPAGTIANIEVLNDGGFILYLTQSISSSCTTYNGIYIASSNNTVTTDGVKTLLAVAIAALTAGKNVTVDYDTSTASCFGKFVQISG